jgi:hypothetical protein
MAGTRQRAVVPPQRAERVEIRADHEPPRTAWTWRLFLLPPPLAGEGGGGGRAAVIQRRPNHLFDRQRILQDLCIPEPQNPGAFSFQPRGPPRIIFRLFCVLSAVHFDDQPRSRQTKSTMYGPKGCWRRNLYPPSCRRRRSRHNKRSASVGCFLSLRALDCLIPPIPTFPRKGGRSQRRMPPRVDPPRACRGKVYGL